MHNNYNRTTEFFKLGKDTVGILAKVSAICSKHNANIIDVTQTVMQDLFAMIMLAETDQMSSDFTAFSQEMKALGEGEGLSIHVMHEDIFNTMHHV